MHRLRKRDSLAIALSFPRFEKLGRGHVWDGQINPCIKQNHVPMPSTGGLTLDC